MAAINANGIPIGGGLGNKKIMLVKIEGTYSTTDRVVIPGVTQDPELFLVSGGANMVFDSGKFKIMMPTIESDAVVNKEIANNTAVAIKGFIIL